MTVHLKRRRVLKWAATGAAGLLLPAITPLPAKPLHFDFGAGLIRRAPHVAAVTSAPMPWPGGDFRPRMSLFQSEADPAVEIGVRGFARRIKFYDSAGENITRELYLDQRRLERALDKIQTAGNWGPLPAGPNQRRFHAFLLPPIWGPHFQSAAGIYG